MHYLLIPFIASYVTFIAQFRHRKNIESRTALIFIASLVLLTLWVVLTFRPVGGDSWRYYMSFLYIRELQLGEVLRVSEADPLYRILSWGVGQLSASPWALYGAITSLYFAVFIYAVRFHFGTVGAAVIVMCYAAYPYFIMYGASGIRQGLSLVFLLAAYVNIRQRRVAGWVFLVMAPFWHSGAWLAVGAVLAHKALTVLVREDRARMGVVLAVTAAAMLLSFSGINEALVGGLKGFVELDKRQLIYFSESEVDYRTGFRWDFAIFTLLPLGVAVFLKRVSPTFSFERSGWWLSLYMTLSVIYHLFSFAPFSDRFGAFAWFLMPFVVYMQFSESDRSYWVVRFLVAISISNIVMLQFYTGNFIGVPRAW